MGVLILGNFTAAEGTTVDAVVVRNETGTGDTLISSGFPVPEGLVSEQDVRDGKIVVKVDGSEVAANVTALRGRHHDGTIRSLLIQFSWECVAEVPVTAQVIIGGAARALADPAYVLPTYAMVQDNNVILPTDTTYLCSTEVALQKLLPAGEGSVSEELFYTQFCEERFDWLVSNSNFGQKNYEHIRGLIAMWSRTGERKYHTQAIASTLAWLPYSTPSDAIEDGCLGDAVANPDGRVSENSSCGLPTEPRTPRLYSFAVAYLLTGYRDLWGTVAYLLQVGVRATDDVSDVLTANLYDLPRNDYGMRYGRVVPALLCEATIPVDGQYHTGTAKNWVEAVDWVVDGLEHYAWDCEWLPFDTGSGTTPAYGATVSQGAVSATILNVYPSKNATLPSDVSAGTGYFQIGSRSGGSFAAGALTISGCTANATGAEESEYRNGMVGTKSYSDRADDEFPVFQLSLPMHALIDSYIYVEKNAKIPSMVKATLDVALQNIRPIEEGDTGYGMTNWSEGRDWVAHDVHPYSLCNPIDASGTSWTLPMFARACAFVYRTVGNDTVNGADYPTWYERLIWPGNVHRNILTYYWNTFGQFWGWGCDTPWIMAQTDLDNETHATMRTPTQWDAIPDATPDVYRGQATP